MHLKHLGSLLPDRIVSVNSHGTGENGPRYLIADFSQLIDETDTCKHVSLIEGSESQTLYLKLRHEITHRS